MQATPIFPKRTVYLPHREQAILQRIKDFAGEELYRPRLESIQQCLDSYQHILPSARVIIGGTNGKGQVANELAYYLKSKKISHSLFTSPHVLSLTERLSYQGKNISYRHFEYLLQRVIERFKQEDLSFYELLLLAFMEGHLHHPVEVMITEVGLGGRFDAVNAIHPTLTAIVSIGHDHTEILGNDLTSILEEKLGITRPNIPLFTTITQDHLRSFCQHYCQQEDIPLYDLWDKLKGPSYFQWNSLLALELAQWITKKKLTPATIPTAGRWETRDEFTFVNAHNIDGLQALVRDPRIEEFQGIIFSFTERKVEEVKQMIEILASCRRPLYFSRRSHFKKLSLANWPVIQEGAAIDSFYPASPGPFLVTGSHYFIGEFQKAVCL